MSPEAEESWGGYDFSKPSQVVVAGGAHGDSAVLWAVGGHIKMEMVEAGLVRPEDLGIEPEKPGIWVWVGKYVWSDGPSRYVPCPH